MVAIAPEQFWQEFSSCLGSAVREEADWLDLYSKNRAWTLFINGVIEETCKRLGFGQMPGTYTREDFRVDFCCFSFSPEDGSDHRSWNFEIAIEHENDGDDWLHEWVKLAHLNCGLRVVISYDMKPDAPDSKLLNRATELLRTRRYSSKENNWLLILGPIFRGSQPEYDFIAFRIDEGKFRQLVDHPVLRSVCS